jgi:hypothetical protein
MRLTVTVKQDDNLVTIRPLIEALRTKHCYVTVLEAPSSLEYAHPFPYVTVEQQGRKHRRFGNDALALMQQLSSQRN